MPTLTNATPRYRHHKASGNAVVTLSGIDHYLGPWQSKASKREYDRLIGEWLAAGRRMPTHANETTVVELSAAYRKFANGYYRKNDEPTRSIERARLASPLNQTMLSGKSIARRPWHRICPTDGSSPRGGEERRSPTNACLSLSCEAHRIAHVVVFRVPP